MVAAGRDPQLEKRERVRRATTLDQVAQLYLEDLRERAESGARRGKRSGYASAKNRLERHVLREALRNSRKREAMSSDPQT